MRCVIVDGTNYRKIEVDLDIIPKVGEIIKINDTLITGKIFKIVHDIKTNMCRNDIKKHIVTIYIE